MTVAACVASVALVLLATTTAAVAMGSDVASGRPTISPNEASAASGPNATGTARLADSIVGVRQGETATLRLTLEDTTNATVAVGGEAVGYNVTVTVSDGDGDGAVPLELRTGDVGMQSTRFLPANDADEYATLNAAPDPDGTVPVGDYPISVYPGHGVAGEPSDVGTLVVTEATPPPNATIEGAGSAVTLHPRAGQVIRGTADLDAGRTVTVRLRSAAGAAPFVKSKEATVGPDGEFNASFDLSGVEAPANATVLVDGTRIAGPAEVDVVTRSPSTPGQPGFGAASSVVAVLAGAALAVLRRR